MKSKVLDYLIVGQGLAGTLLAHFLLKIGKAIHIIDNDYERAASKVAAGIVNPVTGRRYVKSWKIDELLPFVQQTYQELETELGVKLFHSIPIIRTLFNRREENDWLNRSGETGYEKYLLDGYDLEAYAMHTVPAFSYGETAHTARVDLKTLVTACKKKWTATGFLSKEQLDYDCLEFREAYIEYKHFSAKRVIFCEGHQGKTNPFFSYLPFGGAKGEALIVRIKAADFGKIIKHRVFIVPMGQDLYWVGSTSDWHFEHDLPTAKGKQFLEERLKDFLKVPFEIVEHKAAVRPTVKDRRPFLGQHPEFSNLIIFNGLGTKGASLGPYFAQQLVGFLEQKNALDREVDIKRFEYRTAGS